MSDNAYGGRSVQEEVLQKLLSSVHANESFLATMSTPSSASLVPSALIEQRRVALTQGFSELLALEAQSLQTFSTTSLTPPPTSLTLNPPEKVLPQSIVAMFSANAVVKNPGDVLGDDALKSISALAFLCDEVNELADVSTTLIHGVLMFSPRPLAGISSTDEISTERSNELLLCLGNSLPFFQELSNFQRRVARVARNIVCQIGGCTQDDIFRNVHLIPVAEALATCLQILITIDTAVTNNADLMDAWRMYKLIVRDKSNANQNSGTVDAKFAQFEKLLVELDEEILGGHCFLACMEQDFSTGSRNNKGLHTELKTLLLLLYDRYEKLVGSASETTERAQLVGVYGLYAVYRRIVPANEVPDAKLFKKFYTTFPAKCPVIPICGDTAFYPTTFMMEYAPFDVKNLPDATKAAMDYCKRLDAGFPQAITMLHQQCSAWIATADSELAASAREYTQGGEHGAVDVIESRGSLILKGVVIAYRASTLVKTLLALHKSLGTPLTNKLIKPVRQTIEILKAIEVELTNRRRPAIATTIPASLRTLASAVLRKFKALRSVVDSNTKSGGTSRKIRKLAACLAALEGSLKGTSTYGPARRYAAYVAACCCSDSTVSNGVSAADSQQAEALMRRLNLLATFDHQVKTSCSCEFVYFNRELLGVFFQEIWEKEKKADTVSLQLLLNGCADCEQMLRCAPQLAEGDGDAYVTDYRKFVINEVLHEEIIDKLCREVETDLRLAIHTKNLDHMDIRNPVKDKRDKIRPYIVMEPVKVFDQVIDVHDKVKRFLESTFYNLTTLALHDWLTYSEMANLAREKYGLVLADSHLPMGSLDQGLDVLQIMRNIHVFVARFNYNLNQQNFIERRPDRGAKYLNTIGIDSISCSIRQHGLGIMNTTINYTYQFLAKKFHIFSQFLFDDYIRSFLQREKRWFKKHHKDLEVDNKYPFERAMGFVKDIRKLGVTEGKTFLDQFRILISEIGNALGYVRMVRSAGMKSCSDSAAFLPDLELLKSFQDMAGAGSSGEEGGGEGEAVEGAGLSEQTQTAGGNLDAVIDVIKVNLEDSTDYFHILVAVFKEVLMGGGSDHSQLDNFFVIVPALCLSFVEASLAAKDMMLKKQRQARDAYFCDDGFAMGIAYILNILGQTEHFDALHWFQTMREKYEADEKELRTKNAAAEVRMKKKAAEAKKSKGWFGSKKKEESDDSGDEDEVSALQLTTRRLMAHRREGEMLFFSLHGARIFFTDRNKGQEAGKGEAGGAGEEQ